MKISALAIAALAALGMIATAPASAQPGHNRVVVTKTRTVTVHRAGWNNGRHHGWHKKVRVCRNVWRHHHRQRVCTWRYR